MTASYAKYLDNAQRAAVAVAQLPDSLDLEVAYAVQRDLIDCRVQRGERVVGAKLGFTSAAKMAQMGVHEIIAGTLTDAMRLADGASISLGALIHPRIEPEVAFRVCAPLPTDDPSTDALRCVDAVAPALEIIDSRYRDFRFRLSDVVADNASSAAFVIGEWQPISDVRDRKVVLQIDGTVVKSGSTADILGHPVNALRAYAELARSRGWSLRPGDLLLAGAATAAVPFSTALVSAEVDGLGAVSVRGIDG